MSETIEGEQSAALNKYRQTGELPPAKEGLSEVGRRAQTGELSLDNVGQNQRYHRIVTISKETPENRFEQPQIPDVFNPNPDAQEYYRTMAEAERLEREAAKLRKEKHEADENERLDQERFLNWQLWLKKKDQLRAIDKKITDRQSNISDIGDLRASMAEPSIPEQKILEIAANMPESAIVEYAKRTGDIDLLSQDQRISNETVLNVISYLAEQQAQQQKS